MMEQSQDIGELAKALSLAQAEIRDAEKDRTNPHFKSKYATLSSIWDACREPLTKNGLAVVQSPCSSAAEGYIGLATTLLHSSGQWLRDAVFVRLAKDDPQGAGSGLTYLRRYSLAAFVGVCPDDDDGNAGSEPANRHQRAPESRGDAVATREAPATEALVCVGEGCSATLTPGQKAVAVKTYGVPLCPACQKKRQLAAQGA